MKRYGTFIGTVFVTIGAKTQIQKILSKKLVVRKAVRTYLFPRRDEASILSSASRHFLYVRFTQTRCEHLVGKEAD